MKGGYEVRIGRQRAFCPFSQIDTVRHRPGAAHGRVYTFRIIEYKEGGRNLVVSRRALLEEEQRARAAEVRQSIVAGAVLTGRVVSVRDFGAFVDLGGGVQGLLHVSEMGWSRVSDTVAGRHARRGDHRQGAARRRGHAEDRARLEAAHRRSVVDGRRPPTRSARCDTGRVTRVAEFGAFVELEPGIEGARARLDVRADRRARGVGQRSPAGTTAAFEILSIDLEKKRIGVALVPEGSSRAGGAPSSQPEIVAGARLTGKVERHEKFGVFVFLAPGRTGLIPLSETGVAREADVRRRFPVGADVEVVVLEVDPSGRRIRLSRKAVLDAQEADEVREYTEREDSRRRRIRIARRQAPRRTEAAREVTGRACGAYHDTAVFVRRNRKPGESGSMSCARKCRHRKGQRPQQRPRGLA